MIRTDFDTDQGAAVYTPLILKLYDWWVLGFSNRYAWQCSTRAVLLPFFQQHMGKSATSTWVSEPGSIRHMPACRHPAI